MTFVPVFGKQVAADAFKGANLTIPCQSAGLSPLIAMDLAILNDGMDRIGFYSSTLVSPMVVNDALTLPGCPMGAISMPAEFWQDPKQPTKVFLTLRAGVTSEKKFGEELVAFC